MKTFLYFLLGAVAGTVIALGGLLLWAKIFLTPDAGSWDRHDGAAETFFHFWVAFSLALGYAGAWLARRGDKAR